MVARSQARTACFFAFPLLLCPDLTGQQVIGSSSGLNPGDRLGAAITAYTDVDRDGVRDYVVGSPGAAAGGGQVIVVSGRDGSRIRTTTGIAFGGSLGTSLANVGDVNRDGADDLLVGAMAANGGAGAAILFSTSGLPIGRVDGTPGSNLGVVAALGDVDGDRIPDYAIGAPGGNGAVQVRSGGNGNQLWIASGATGEQLGATLAGLGDVNGDSIPDLAVTAAAAGRVEVRTGSTGAVLWTVSGTGEFGAALSAVGDLDADGGVELMVGAPNTRGTTPGSVQVLAAATGAHLFTLVGDTVGDGFGTAVAGLTDLDFDGVVDFVVSGPGYDRTPSVDVGLVRGYSGRLRRPLFELAGARQFERLGDRFAPGNDIDRDGIADFLVAAPAWNGNRGQAAVYSATSGFLRGGNAVVPLDAGGRQDLLLRTGPTYAGLPFLVVGSASVSTSGTRVGRLTLPLDPDSYLAFTALNPNRTPLPNSTGLLDSNGRGLARFEIPAGLPPALAGLRLFHAALVIGPGAIPALASNPVPVALVATDPEQTITETFADAQMLDRAASSGNWANGFARGGQLGLDGLHGDFDPALGTSIGPNQWLWDLDTFVIPASRTLSGRDEPVVDGVLRFASFDLPRGTVVRFAGSKPAQIFVRGSAEVFGKVDASGVTADPAYPGKRLLRENFPGQPTSPGGPGGGAGGAGGDLLMNMGLPGNGNRPEHNGRDGGDVQVAASHAYAGRAAGTGGKGSHQWPASGLDADVIFGYFNTLCTQTPAPGSGGGFQGAGGIGDNTSTVGSPPERAPDVPGGAAFDLDTNRQGRTSRIHYAVGGAGGGGGGCNTFYTHRTQNRFYWIAGGAGGGGGGALVIRAGHDLVTGPNGEIDVSGGGGSTGGTISNGPACVGGGGSGGTALLQFGGGHALQGTLRATGGPGGRFFSTLGGLGQFGEMLGGAGADGFFRVEAPVPPSLMQLGTTFPPATADNVGRLDALDNVVGCRSKWYRVPGAGGVRQVLRYELVADVFGVMFTFSDDPQRGQLALYGGSEPVWLLVQSASLDGTGEPIRGTLNPWRSYAGRHATAPAMADDEGNAFRFTLLFNQTVNRSTRAAELRLVYR